MSLLDSLCGMVDCDDAWLSPRNGLCARHQPYDIEIERTFLGYWVTVSHCLIESDPRWVVGTRGRAERVGRRAVKRAKRRADRAYAAEKNRIVVP